MVERRVSVLAYSEDPQVEEFFLSVLRLDRYVVYACHNGQQAKQVLGGQKINIVVAFNNPPDFISPDIPVVVFTEEDALIGRVEIHGLTERAGMEELPNISDYVYSMIGRRRFDSPSVLTF